MSDLIITSLATIIPPLLTAVFAYLIARKRNSNVEKIARSKAEADVQIQALQIVQDVMNDMRNNFHRELETMQTNIKTLQEDIAKYKSEIEELHKQLSINDELVETLKSEISLLKKTLLLYEEENKRLRKEV